MFKFDDNGGGPFPAAPFDDEISLGVLRELGILSFIGRDGVIDRVQKINDLLNVGSDEATEQAQTISSALLAYLKDDVVFSALLEAPTGNLNVTPVDEFLRLLQEVPWVPCRGTALYLPSCIPLPVASMAVPIATAQKVALEEDAYMLEGSTFLLRAESFRSSCLLSRTLGWIWTKPSSTSAGSKERSRRIVDHLKCLISAVNTTSFEGEKSDQEWTALKHYVTLATTKCYKALNDIPRADWVESLRGEPFVWVPEHGVFCGTHQLALNPKEELSPALNKVPVAVEYSWMRLEFDVQDTFETAAYQEVLREIQRKEGTMTDIDVTNSIKVLTLMYDDRQQQLLEATEGEDASGAARRAADAAFYADLLCPTSHTIGAKQRSLVPAHSVYKISAPEDLEDISDEKIKATCFLHGDMPLGLSQKLHLLDVRQMKMFGDAEQVSIAVSAEGVYIDDDDEDEDEIEYGITLTNFLRNTLKDYPAGSGIVKELLQNADDAKASDFKVCLDLRSFEPTASRMSTTGMKLLDPDMGGNGFLGPAVLCYNNAVFEDEDIRSILSPGVSQKQGNVSKTGKFGLGFNSVFHITDMPSFATRDEIIYLDPHQRYLPPRRRTRAKDRNYFRYKFVKNQYVGAELHFALYALSCVYHSFLIS